MVGLVGQSVKEIHAVFKNSVFLTYKTQQNFPLHGVQDTTHNGKKTMAVVVVKPDLAGTGQSTFLHDTIQLIQTKPCYVYYLFDVWFRGARGAYDFPLRMHRRHGLFQEGLAGPDI